LRFTGKSKKELMWQLHFRLGKEKVSHVEQVLFTSPRNDATLPALEHHWLEDVYDELELIGFPLCNPFDLIDTSRLPQIKLIEADQLHEHIHQVIDIIGYKVTLKPTGTTKGEGMFFGTFLDRSGRFIDTVHFPPVAKAFPVSGWGLFHIQGKVTEEFGALTVEVKRIERLPLLPDPRVTDGPSHPALQRKGSSNDRWVNRQLHGRPKL
jgi:DNA polymerase-3 subunit alpha